MLYLSDCSSYLLVSMSQAPTSIFIHKVKVKKQTRKWEEDWSMSDRCKPDEFRTTTTARELLLRVSTTTKLRCNPLLSLSLIRYLVSPLTPGSVSVNRNSKKSHTIKTLHPLSISTSEPSRSRMYVNYTETIKHAAWGRRVGRVGIIIDVTISTSRSASRGSRARIPAPLHR